MSSEDRIISSLVVVSQIHELIDNCYAITMSLTPATKALIPLPALKIARNMLPNMYPKDLFTDDEKEPEINTESALLFAKKNNLSMCYMLFDSLLEKLDDKFMKAISMRDEEYFLENMSSLLKGTVAESLTGPLQVIITNPELTAEHKSYIWENLDSISEEVQDYRSRL